VGNDQVNGIRCERCVNRLAGALTGRDDPSRERESHGPGDARLDDERTTREALLAAMAQGGFREILAA
jgi:hypothetical protein